MLCAVFHSPFLDIGDARGDADDHAQRRVEPRLAPRDQLDHAFDHLFGGFKIRDHAILERTNRLDVFVRLSVHLLGQTPNRDDVACHTVFGHDGRLVHHHLVLVVDDGVGRAQIHGNLLREKIKQSHCLKVEAYPALPAPIKAKVGGWLISCILPLFHPKGPHKTCEISAGSGVPLWCTSTTLLRCTRLRSSRR